MTKIDGGLNDEFRKHLPGIFFQRIETGGTGRGIPDSCYCGRNAFREVSQSVWQEPYVQNGTMGWVEFKTTDGWVCGLRPEQLGWGDRWARSGGRLWLALRRRAAAGVRRGEAVDELWMVPGRSWVMVGRVGLRGLVPQEHDHRLWTGGPQRWGWDAVRSLLLD